MFRKPRFYTPSESFDLATFTAVNDAAWEGAALDVDSIAAVLEDRGHAVDRENIERQIEVKNFVLACWPLAVTRKRGKKVWRPVRSKDGYIFVCRLDGDQIMVANPHWQLTIDQAEAVRLVEEIRLLKGRARAAGGLLLLKIRPVGGGEVGIRINDERIAGLRACLRETLAEMN